MSAPVRLVSGIGEYTLAQLGTARDMMGLFYDTVLGFATLHGRRRISAKQMIGQVLFTGVDALVIVGLIALLCGITIVIQAMDNMPKIGAGEYFGRIMILVVVRELGPLFTTLVVIGRSGAALAAYIGNMRVTKEVSALKAIGVDLVHFLVMPAFVGMIVSLVCLSVYFDIIAIVGGLLVAQFVVDIPFLIFMKEVAGSLEYLDIVVPLVKSVASGAIVAIVSCHHGLSASSIRHVPRAVYKTVVGSIVATMLCNVLLTVFFYAGHVG